jgi:(1->4)-alpha-D-glucan 1-alpha-D-glucosylmutase
VVGGLDRGAAVGLVKRPALRAPRATYRLQFTAGFGFEDARQVVPYLATLGVSHVYASPIFMAREGSAHGYDIVDHTRLNPELGGREVFDAFVAELHRHDMGLILDFVPNHMGIGRDNPWWTDVLEWGPTSPYAAYFDIDWASPERTLVGKVLLPILGDHYGAVLDRGELQLNVDRAAGTFEVGYHEHRLPIGPKSYPGLLQAAIVRAGDAAHPLEAIAAGFRDALTGRRSAGARRQRVAEGKARLARVLADDAGAARAVSDAVADLNGRAGEAASFDALHRLLERQSYRLAYWRVAAHEINYRRFFDINELAGLRMEVPQLFEASHTLIARLLAEGKVDGLRLDHVDGLRDPKGYLERLQRLASRARPRADGPDEPLYVVVEKILARHEALRSDWAASGTTGYEFLADANGLQVDATAERALTRTYARLTGAAPDLEDMIVAAKHEIMSESLASELNVLANGFTRLAKQHRISRDYPLLAFREALANVVAHFPVYRTYVTPRSTTSEDRRDIDWAVAKARRAARTPDTSIYDFVSSVLTLDLLRDDRSYRRRDVVDAALKFQQYTGPVTAKAVEDTTFYRAVRLVSLNEVGSEPDRFGTSPSAFHEANRRRHRSHPDGMLTTSTHDHKRGEDLRARLNVLSEVPRAWRGRVQRWMLLNRRKRSEADGRAAPSRGDEYLFYQTVVGAWPFSPAGAEVEGTFVERIDAYMLKAIREAKEHTSWAAPHEEYERAVSSFVTRCLDPELSRPFVEDVAAFVREIAPAGAVNGLAQVVLKLTSPGVPDVYQGTELWDFSLVDPDNRRPVDYATRRAFLGRPSAAGEELASWHDGRIKQRIIQRLLEVRRAHPELFTGGAYLPLAVEGLHADRVIAFARRHEDRTLVVIAPRLVWSLLQEEERPLPRGWGSTRVMLPEELRAPALVDVLSGREPAPDAEGALPVESCLSELPVAALLGA